MRVVHIIDSLEVGGAERMAVNYANALYGKVEFSGLISTRNEGLLINQVDERVSYLFLNKKRRIDFRAILKLRKYLRSNKVQIIHAHSSSFFIAVLVKCTMLKLKIIWHDHFGVFQNLDQRKNLPLRLSSFFFSGIISVNVSLKKWAQDYLNCSKVIYFPNFIKLSNTFSGSIELKGFDGKRIVCVANLRPQKNHELLINGAAVIREKFPEWTFHLIGKDFNDLHSKSLVEKVNKLDLSQTVFFYGAVNHSQELLKYCEIAVLTSFSEGLPLAVLEYGLSGLPVVATNVGEISKIIPSLKEGVLIESNNLDQFVKSVQKLIIEEKTRKEMGQGLKFFVEQNFSENAIVSDYLSWLKSLTVSKK